MVYIKSIKIVKYNLFNVCSLEIRKIIIEDHNNFIKSLGIIISNRLILDVFEYWLICLIC